MPSFEDEKLNNS